MRKLDEKYLKSLEEEYEKMNKDERQGLAKKIVHRLFQLDLKHNRR